MKVHVKFKLHERFMNSTIQFFVISNLSEDGTNAISTSIGSLTIGQVDSRFILVVQSSAAEVVLVVVPEVVVDVVVLAFVVPEVVVGVAEQLVIKMSAKLTNKH